MKIFLTALLGLILVCSAKDLAFKDSGIKSRALDQAFLKTILEYQGELTKDIIEKTLELGVTQVFVDASYGYDKALIQHITEVVFQSLENKYTSSNIEAALKAVHERVDEIRNKMFDELTSIYALKDLSQDPELDKELWNYVSQYPEKFGFTYSHYVVVRQANDLLEKHQGGDVNDATKTK